MDYGALIKRAWEITKKYKFLWIFGILVGGAPSIQIPITNFQYTVKDEGELEKVLTPEVLESLKTFFVNNLNLILALAFVLFLIILILFILSIIFRGALIGTVGEIEKGQEVNFKKGFQVGSHHFWRILGLSILLFLLILLSLVILATPVALLASFKIYVLAIILGILFLLLYLIWTIFLNLSFQYALRFLIIGDFGIIQSIKQGFSLFRKFWKEILLVWLITLGLSIGLGIFAVIVVFVALIPLGLLGFVIYTLSQLGLWIYGTLAILALVIGISILSGAISTFLSSIWTLAYLELTAPNLSTRL